MTRSSLCLFLLLFLTACTPSGETPPEVAPTTLLPSPTWTPSLPPASPTLSPTREPPTPTVPEPSPTWLPTVTDTLVPLPSLAAPTVLGTPVAQPAADSGAVQILAPGPLSKVVSPIRLRGYAIPGGYDRARIELFGEDGRLLTRVILNLFTTNRWAYISYELPFEIHAAGELGRLSVSTEDEFGRTMALYSVHLLLLSEGKDLINPPGNLKERCVLESPSPDSSVSGGILWVNGEMRPFNSLPLVVELVATDGSVLGSRMVSVQPAGDDRYLPFRIDIPYTVSLFTRVRLTIRQNDDRIGGRMYVYSQLVLLRP